MTAIGHRPPEHGRRDRDHAEDGGGGRQQDRPQPVFGGADHRRPGMFAVGDVLVDLGDEDHGIADHHADQRNHAENGNEAHRSMRDQEGSGHADQRQRRSEHDQKQPLKAHELDHQDCRHQKQPSAA